MKPIARFLVIVGLAVLAWGCSNDFLKDNELIYFTVEEPLVISSQQPQGSISFHLPEAGDHPYYIRTHPKWMDIEPMQGRFSGGGIPLLYTMSQPDYQTGDDYYTGWLEVVVDGIGYYQVQVWYGNFSSTQVPGGSGQETPSVTEGDVTDIDGVVVDAAYDRTRDQLIIATKNPNQLLLVDTNTGNSSLLPLDMTPKCLALSDDGKAYVGFSIAYLSVYNLETKQQLQSYPLDCIPYDLALVENNWCYISPMANDFERLRSLNLNTGELTETGQSPLSDFYGYPYLREVPGKSLLAAGRQLVTPSGFMLIDISQGLAADTIAYWHEHLINFWISNDAQYVYAASGEVYFMPEYTTAYNPDNLNQYGQLELDRHYIADLKESTAKNCLFVAATNNWDGSNNDMTEGSLIQQFDARSLTLQKRYEPSLELINQNGSIVVAFHDIRYVFVNSSTTKLFAIRRIASYANSNDWSYEVFEVD